MDPAPPAPAAAGADPLSWSGWRLWLLLGASFGLGYGVCQRLLALDLPLNWSSPERFSVKAFPGTELNSLRSRLGDTSLPIRGDLDLLELERQQQREAAALKQRRSQMEAPPGEPQDLAPLGDPAPLPPVPADPAAPAAQEPQEAPEASAPPEPVAPPPTSPPAAPPANASPCSADLPQFPGEPPPGMSAPHTLVQAAVHRLSARMGSALVDTAASLAVFAQDGPARLQQEISLFWEEVELEAERLERGDTAPIQDTAPAQAAAAAKAPPSPAAPPPDPQEQIDQLRARVAELGRRLEQSAS